ncbi:MAG: hypothetical protein IJX27_08950 [Clostridia bacterium]|nr:hypothetical protein [Clostridia bacterium]
MKKEDISNALNNIDFDMVEDAYERTKKKKTGKKHLLFRFGTVAACLMLIIVGVATLPQEITPGISTSDTQGNNTNPTVTADVSTNNTNQSVTTSISVNSTISSENTDISVNSTIPSKTTVPFTQAPHPSIYAPKEFTSISDFVAYEKSLGEASSECYYIPSNLGDDYELYSILRQEKNPTITYEHITVKYKLKGADIDEENLIDLRQKIISCEYSVREYSDSAFENYVNNGFEAFEYSGKQIYKIDTYTADKTTLLSYRVIFRIDGHLIGMHIPATDSFENMLKYIDVTRVDIK